MGEDMDRNEMVRLLRSIDGRLARIAREADKPPSIHLDPNSAYSRREAAHLMGVSVWLVDRARKRGDLIDCQKLGERDVRVTGHSILAFLTVRQGKSKVLRI